MELLTCVRIQKATSMNMCIPKQLAIILVLFLYGLTGTAQISYTDVTDTTISRSTNQSGTLSYSFDINNDAANDFTLAVRSTVVTPVGCPNIFPATQTNLLATVSPMPATSNQVGDSASSAAHVNYSSLIDSNSYAWVTTNLNNLYNSSYTYPSCTWSGIITGNWTYNDTAYVALKFKSGPSVYFGWVRIYIGIANLGANDYQISLTVLDYAYNSSAGDPINAGDNGLPVNVESHETDLLSFFPNPVKDRLSVVNPLTQKIIFRIYDSNGRLVHDCYLNGGENSLDVAYLAHGIYHYSFISGEKVLSSGKFVKE
jgi:hypothetical protein